jgi:pyruvate ferredoxin oxidoreductase gamma subunit
MLRVRLHGRGGQGVKTAGHVLGNALFRSGYEVQDAPRYGAERRGAPMFAYVRADRQPIVERGVIQRPDLVVVVDDMLVGVPAAAVTQGIDAHTTLLIRSAEPASTWQHRLNTPARVICLNVAEADAILPSRLGIICAGAAARLLGVVTEDMLQRAISEELHTLARDIIAANIANARAAYAQMSEHAGCVQEGTQPAARDYTRPDWVDLPLEGADVSAPVIHAGATSVEVRTGLWRSHRPVVHTERCHRCWWICSSFCPDSAITVGTDGYPKVDYDHCKGCMVCVAQCPSHAIEAVPETQFQETETTS